MHFDRLLLHPLQLVSLACSSQHWRLYVVGIYNCLHFCSITVPLVQSHSTYTQYLWGDELCGGHCSVRYRWFGNKMTVLFLFCTISPFWCRFWPFERASSQCKHMHRPHPLQRNPEKDTQPACQDMLIPFRPGVRKSSGDWPICLDTGKMAVPVFPPTKNHCLFYALAGERRLSGPTSQIPHKWDQQVCSGRMSYLRDCRGQSSANEP